MASACPRCGATKSESVRHGLVYATLGMIGYRLRRCSSCQRWRVLSRRGTDDRNPYEMTAEELRERFNQEVAKTLKKPSTTAESAANNMTVEGPEKPAMPVPAPARSSRRKPESGGETDGYHICPICGSSNYHHSRRRWYERLVGRRRMARCMKCNHRFPYPH
jgi:hypothetical protein